MAKKFTKTELETLLAGSATAFAFAIIQRASKKEFDPEDYDDNYGLGALDEMTTAGGLTLKCVEAVGGGEGGGDSVVRVIQVSKGKDALCYLRIGGYYSSDIGTDWDEEAEFVEPYEVMVTKYRKIDK